MRALALLAALAALLPGCGGVGAVKGFEGPDRPDSEVGLLETEFRDDTFLVMDNAVTGVDGVKFAKPGYAARILPGSREIGVASTLRVSRQKRTQHCVFTLDVQAGCTYRPTLPNYPRAALDASADTDWRVDTFMTVAVECPDMAYASRLPVRCEGHTPPPLTPAVVPGEAGVAPAQVPAAGNKRP